MNTRVDKDHGNVKKMVANETSQKQGHGKSTFQFADNRSETITQRNLQEMANNSSRMKELRVLQKMATSSVTQMKAGVESFTTTWTTDNRGPTGAGYRTDSSATFRDGGEFNADDAEFRQCAAHKWKVRKVSGGSYQSTEIEQALEDDSYNRVNDPGDYNGATFQTHDLPGWKAGELESTDLIDWKFYSEQYIVDISNGDEVIAYVPGEQVSILVFILVVMPLR